MAQTMSKDEYLAFLSAGTRTGKLATAGRDGRPHVAPIWFILDGETLVFTTGRGTVKGRRIRRDPRVALVVDDETPPYAYVLVEGTVETSLCPPICWTGPRASVRGTWAPAAPTSTGSATPPRKNCWCG